MALPPRPGPEAGIGTLRSTRALTATDERRREAIMNRAFEGDRRTHETGDARLRVLLHPSCVCF